LAFWQSLPSVQQTKAYYQFWVVKEAFAKALGVGLSIPTDRFLTVDAMNQKQDGKIEYWLNRDTSIIGRFQQKDISANQVCAMVMVVSDNPSFVEIGVT
jgi:phosphopantetheinyl transferase